jgi:phenylacetate-CoA ligase
MRYVHQILSSAYYRLQIMRGRICSNGAIDARQQLLASMPEEFEAHQLNRLRALIVYASQHVPYYRDLFARKELGPHTLQSLADLKRFPTLDKSTVRAAGGEMLSEAVRPGDLRKNASGGSTGAPLHFYQDTTYTAESNISTAAFNAWTGYRRGEPIALLWGASRDNTRFDRERLRNFLQNRFLIDAFNMDEVHLAEAVEKLQWRKPALVIAYASVAYLIARYMQRERVFLRHSPKGVITSAEVLWPHYREAIEHQFGCKAYNRYGSREVGPVAMECSHGSLHVNAADLVVEIDDPDDSDVGELLVTQLNNFSFPFIRYRVGDLAAMVRRSCPCGRRLPVLENLKGRVSDHIIAPDGALIHGEWFTHLFYEVEGVALFTFRQTGRTSYIFEVQKDRGFDAPAFERAVAVAQNKLGPAARIEVKFVERFESSPSGKHCFVVNECPEETGWFAGKGVPTGSESTRAGGHEP